MKKLCLLVLGLMFVLPAIAVAQEDNRVLVVPYSQKFPDLPHPAYEGDRKTLKAVIQNANCNVGYQIAWDTDRDGDFTDEYTRNVGRDGNCNCVRDAGRLYTVPDVDEDQELFIDIQVTNFCTGEKKYDTFLMYVYDFKPDNNASTWVHSNENTRTVTKEQLEIMTQAAIQESMWYTHRQMGSITGSDAQLWGRPGDQYAAPIELWQYLINGHLPAYPVGAQLIGTSACGNNNDCNQGYDFNGDGTSDYGKEECIAGQCLPEGFRAANDERFRTDPYAETAMRIANYMAKDATTYGIGGNEEENTNGWSSPGVASRITALPAPFNTRLDGAGGDNTGAAATGARTRSGNQQDVYKGGMNLGGLAPVLPALHGTVLQVGNNGLYGRKWEFFIQQLTDTVGYQQCDGGGGNGGWYYQDENHACTAHQSDASSSQWSYIGLESAEIAGGPFGVVVNNRFKYRIADNLVHNQRGNGGSGYRSDMDPGDHKLTGGALVAARWLKFNVFPDDNVKPYGDSESFGNKKHSEFKQIYERYLAFIAQDWNAGSSKGTIWSDSMWSGGDYLCGSPNGVYNGPRCGDTYAMYSIQKGLRTGAPFIETVGNADWVTQFTTYYIRAMRRNTDGNSFDQGSYDEHGRIRDDNNWGHHHAIGGHPTFVNSMGALTMTPSIFSPRPVAKAGVGTQDATVAEVVEGCFAGEGRVDFYHGESFHPNPERRIVLYQWDFDDDDNGLWWKQDALNPDFFTPKLGQTELVTDHVYPRAGTYTATLRVVENVTNNNEEPLDDTTTVTVIVRPAENKPPSAVHGGPYAMEEDGSLVLNGNASDLNEDCGDNLTVVWQVQKNGGWQDIAGGQGTNPTIPWATIDALNLQLNGAANPIRIAVTDSNGAPTVYDETSLKIYGKDPIAVASISPGTLDNPAACGAEVTFDCNASSHPNPERIIASCQWDVDNVNGFEGDGKIFRYTYNQYGALPDRSYRARLRVTDDLQRTAETEVDVFVSAGNQPPTARVSSTDYVVLEGDDLNLDASASEDANADCGDSIVSYVWTLADGTEIGNGEQAALTWAQMQALGNKLSWPANSDTGLPTNIVTMTVTDSFGATASIQTKITIYQAKPTAVVVQTPNPAMIRRNNGLGEVELNGGESTSPIPGRQVTGFEWVFDREEVPDANTAISAQGRAVNFVKPFDPVPTPETIPDVYVWLRVEDDGQVRRKSDWTRYRVIYNVPPTLPTADADPTDPPEAGYDIIVGGDLTVDGSKSFDPDDDDFVRFYRWDFSYVEGEGLQTIPASIIDDAAGIGGETAKLTISWDDLQNEFGIAGAGEYTIALQVQDNFGQTNMDVATLTVHERDPVAGMVINPNPAACGAQVTFDASESDHPHPGIDIAGIGWDFDNDGEYDDGEGAVTTYRFNTFTFSGLDVVTGNVEPGSIAVSVKVVDTEGNSTTVSDDMVVTLGNNGPSANAGGFRTAADEFAVAGPYAIAVGEPVTLNGDLSFDPDELCGDRLEAVSWDIGADGSFEFGKLANRGDLDDLEVTVSWAELQGAGINVPGTYSVLLRAEDRFGVTSDAIASLVVTAGPEALASATPSRQSCGELVEFSATRSRGDGPDGQGFAIVSYEWDFDEPYFEDAQDVDATGEVVNQNVSALPVNGLIFVEGMLRVTDGSGRTDTTSIRVDIESQNLAPVADAGGPYSTGCLGNCNDRQFSLVQLDGRSSLDPNVPCDELAVYKWDTDGDGQFGNDDNPPDLMGALPAPFSRNGDGGWNPGTTQTVELIVCDLAGLCSAPKSASIVIREESPPSGSLVSPRAGACVGDGQIDVEFTVSDPEGELITVEVEVNGNVVGSKDVDTPNDGSAVTQVISFNAGDVDEGRHSIIINFDDTFGGEATVDSGGQLVFDRTGPSITIGAQPVADVCYQQGNIPDADIEVEDRFDNSPQYSTGVVDNGCGRTLEVTAVDACGNESVSTRGYRVAAPVELDIIGAEEGELLPDARIEWDVIGLDACASDISADYAVDGVGRGVYPEGQLLDEPGNYALTIVAKNCAGLPRTLIRNFTVNAPPVVVPLPGGHPNQDPNDATRYLVSEGQPLILDGSSTRAPEAEDRVVAYEWDWDVADGMSFAALNDCDPAQSMDLTGAAEVLMQPWDDFHTASCVRVSPNTTVIWEGDFLANPMSAGLNDGGDGPDAANNPIQGLQGDDLQKQAVFTDAGLYPYYSPNDPDTFYGLIVVTNANGLIPSMADGNGVNVNYPTDDDGLFTATLRATDDLGASASETVAIKIEDVDPIANAGGPYVTNQGVEIVFDASGSRPGSPINAQTGLTADPISEFKWDWDDGTPTEAGLNLDRPAHTFAEHGVFNVTLTVTDEEPDSNDVETIRVEVRDVDPVVGGVTWPNDLFEIRPMEFVVAATPGAPGDPITRVEWDMDQDGVIDYVGADALTVEHSFETAGTYTVTVRVFDGDSDILEARQVDVAEITMLKLLEWLSERALEEVQNDQYEVAQRRPLSRAIDNKAFEYAIWGENRGRRGNTMLSVQGVVDGLVQSQELGIDFGFELWALSRQLHRVIVGMKDNIENNQPALANDISMQRANGYIDQFELIYLDENFRQDVSGIEKAFLATDLVALATEAYFWLSDLTDQCNAYDRFNIPPFGSRSELMDNAVAINADLVQAVQNMKADLQQYINEANANATPGPGGDDVNGALNTLTEMLGLLNKPIRDPCPEGVDCVTDREALEMELKAMDLVKQLVLAEGSGVWVRNWQTCLTMGLKFRIEMSMQRVEFVCGVNLELPRRARAVQKLGLDLVDAGDFPGALEYYADEERTCLMVEIYNECIVPLIREEDAEGNFTVPLDPYAQPAFCGEDAQ